jgi:hypothetical protein
MTHPLVNVPATQIVVAHYDEDLSWLESHAHVVTVYHKGPQPLQSPGIFSQTSILPNVGRESHTYLHHIVHHYHDLADVTLFTQGQVDDHLGPEITLTQMLDACRSLPENDPFMIFSKHGLKQFDRWSGIPHVKKWKEDQESGVLRSADTTPGEFWKWVFGFDHPDVITFSWGAIFAVRKEAIWTRSREFYERLLGLFEQIGHLNPEEGHFMERFWLSIFVPGRTTVPSMPNHDS